jgi:hypothetical protein
MKGGHARNNGTPTKKLPNAGVGRDGGAYFVSYLGRSEGDLGGHKSRDLFRRVVREAFLYINSINFDLMTLLRELLKIL